jgi:hypothetical protein
MRLKYLLKLGCELTHASLLALGQFCMLNCGGRPSLDVGAMYLSDR